MTSKSTKSPGPQFGFLDQFETLETLGQGTFGIVKRCRNKKTKEEFAVKIIRSRVLNARIENETKICSQLQHPNIVRLHNTFQDDMQYYMIFDLVTGGELFDDIVKREYYSELEASRCIQQVLEAVAYCHDNNIIHRDIKPENLLLSISNDQKIVKLADFGLAMELQSDNPATDDWAGTPCYISPEILLNRPYSKPVDMWACGVILYVLLVGFLPFWDDNPKVLESMITSADYDFFGSQWDGVTKLVKSLINQMLVFDPQSRITAKQALKHKWIAKREVATSKIHMSQAIIELKELGKARHKWKVIGKTVMMSNKFRMLIDKELGEDKDGTVKLNPIQEIVEEIFLPIHGLVNDESRRESTIISSDAPHTMALEHRDDLRHHESDFRVDIIAITERITEALVYGHSDIYQKLSHPDCTSYSPQLEIRDFKHPLVSINDPIVHMIGMNGACIFYTKVIAYLGSNSKYEIVAIPETRVWKNFDWEWRCVHFHTS